MSLRQLPTPQLPGVSVDIDLPRWLPKAIRIGLGLTIVFIIGVAIASARLASSSDTAWAYPTLSVDEMHRADTGVWEFDVLVVAGTEGGALQEGWSVVLANGGVIPAIGQSGEVLGPGGRAQIRVRAIYAYNGQPSPGDPIALRWDPNNRLGIQYPLTHLQLAR